MFNRHRICDVKPQKEYDLSRSFMRIDISRDHSGDEPQEGETEDDEIPCKRRNQEAKSESPITQPSSTPALYNSTTESDCETLSNSIVESRPASEWNDPEKPGSSRLPWMDLVDDIYLEVKALKDLDSNHLSFPQFADAFMLRTIIKKARMIYKIYKAVFHDQTPEIVREPLPVSVNNSQNRKQVVVSTSPSISSLSQTTDIHGSFQANQSDRKAVHLIVGFILVLALGAVTISGYSIIHQFEQSELPYVEKPYPDVHPQTYNESRSLEALQEMNAERIAGTCAKSWHYDVKHQMCYKKIYNVAYDDALRRCARMGAHIVKIDNQQKNSIIREFTSSGFPNDLKSGNVLLGARKKRTDFVWDDGSQFSYHRWAENEPNNRLGVEACIAMYSDPIIGLESLSDDYISRWNDVPCDQTQRITVCEKRAQIQN
ncbi:unnamed protein product, partial [Mesorhabditis belari]|uniref:C-type lectin domain-containing protein n=1 Tax=Mesorhabditis belari TaxID=2138241 RepID=A0AAF3J5R6_9BILA